jgi:hypothetical protein
MYAVICSHQKATILEVVICLIIRSKNYKYTMEDIIEIDGCLHEGGGQMIRSSLALSLILKK